MKKAFSLFNIIAVIGLIPNPIIIIMIYFNLCYIINTINLFFWGSES